MTPSESNLLPRGCCLPCSDGVHRPREETIYVREPVVGFLANKSEILDWSFSPPLILDYVKIYNDFEIKFYTIKAQETLKIVIDNYTCIVF